MAENGTNSRPHKKYYLNKNNFRVSTADNAKKAREKIENIEFDLIILDIMMPGESGLTLTNSLKKNNFKTPKLLLRD